MKAPVLPKIRVREDLQPKHMMYFILFALVVIIWWYMLGWVF